MKMNELVNGLKANQRLVAFWSVAIVLVIGAWMFMTRKSPAPAVADEPAPVITPPVVAPVVITPAPVPLKPTLSITKSTNSGKMDEYQQIAKFTNLQGDQLAKFQQACAEREIVLAYWTKGPGKKVEAAVAAMKAAKDAKDEKAIATLRPTHDMLVLMENDLRTNLRANIMTELTLEQQRRWAGYLINVHLLNRLTRIELSDRQKEFIRRLADDAADRNLKADTVEKDPFFNTLKSPELINGLLKQTRDKILTIEQRARIPDPNKPNGVPYKSGNALAN
ncbi:MAG TPA: hypothetical protein VGQ99_10460 [Tepidisphaeraceae bacterium]|jgi:hypothetical protein|nr:hypothetical protein [Tepidisphaeraceae bacterium]